MDIPTCVATLNFVDAARPLWANCLVLLWALIIGHALADFPLQGDFLATAKDRHCDLDTITGKTWPPGTWLYCLTIHSLIHSGMVLVITGSVILSLIEFVLHWVIDLAKNERWTNFFVDQVLHILCKIGYVYPFCSGILTW